MCGIWDWQSTIVKDLNDSQDPKHTLFCRKIVFVAIYAFFSDNKCPLFTRLGGGGSPKADNVCFLTVFYRRASLNPWTLRADKNSETSRKNFSCWGNGKSMKFAKCVSIFPTLVSDVRTWEYSSHSENWLPQKTSKEGRDCKQLYLRFLQDGKQT